jgi:hypothetical protein
VVETVASMLYNDIISKVWSSVMAVYKTCSEAMESFLKNPSDLWKFGNSVLYDMCSSQPLHTDPDVIVGKLWLIGRSYAAAIERRKTGDRNDTEAFYYDIVAPKIMDIGQELDERISRLNSFLKPTEDNLDLILNTHKFLTDVFNEITELEKRSLASKYLHFHCPQMFYIYDSRSSAAIRKYVPKNANRLYKHYPCGCDTEYADFCVRAIELQEFVERKHSTVLSPREIDNFLLYYK